MHLSRGFSSSWIRHSGHCNYRLCRRPLTPEPFNFFHSVLCSRESTDGSSAGLEVAGIAIAAFLGAGGRERQRLMTHQVRWLCLCCVSEISFPSAAAFSSLCEGALEGRLFCKGWCSLLNSSFGIGPVGFWCSLHPQNKVRICVYVTKLS